jgi:D-alanyl-D-alanine carboxypeptidase/D-alanyl-D-alanine-endopeptidase (penicillin-binding protein 4)
MILRASQAGIAAAGLLVAEAEENSEAMRKTFTAIAFGLIAFMPLPVEDGSLPQRASVAAKPAAESQALAEFKRRLLSDGRELREHGIYIETLDGAEPIAALNEDAYFNPASVIKLATSLVALEKLGAHYRFRTELRAAGEVDARSGEWQGDLILASNDPSFSIQNARDVGDRLRHLGIRRVSGSLVVNGAFTCNHNSQTGVSAGVFRRHIRVPIRGVTRYENRPVQALPGRVLLALESEPLIRILQEQNAYSVNSMADVLGQALGGPEAIKEYLVKKLQLPPNTIHLTHASGLEINRLTPRATARVLRALARYLSKQGASLEAIMPVAGMDPGTLLDRFAEDEFLGSVIAKTGTLYGTDGGVAALAGVALTRKRGPVLFVIYDMAEGRNVLRLRRMQDEFLKDLIRELGGPAPLPVRLEDKAAESAISR